MFDFLTLIPYPYGMSKNEKELPAASADDLEFDDLTQRQVAILEVIKKAIESQGYPPAMREIGLAAGLASPASVQYQLKILEEKGWIRRDATKGRAIELLNPHDSSFSDTPIDKSAMIPVVGRIAAGSPILADQSVEEMIPMPESVVGKGELFALRVVGDSMIEAAICDGDLVIIRSQKSCEKGEIVAAMIDGEATVKTFSKKDGHIWLLPANPAYQPINGDNAEILGKVTAVMRSL
jgi:repressor LexA